MRTWTALLLAFALIVCGTSLVAVTAGDEADGADTIEYAKVLKDGRDVTSEWLSGDTVKIPADSGNVVVIAKASLPWLYILIAAIVVIAIVTFLILRRRSE